MSRGLLRLTVPAELEVRPSDSTLHTSDGRVRLSVKHFPRSDSAQQGLVFTPEDVLNRLMDSLIFEASYLWISRPMDRYCGLMKGHFIVAARDSQTIATERTEFILLESPRWLHLIKVELRGPRFTLMREQLDEIYDSATELQSPAKMVGS
ncbi:MAG: hypothetical protein N2110_01865 [Flavobacteriales bacterium]|nr:hypothetical protein [Flavobacteriales bacterium]